jgi:hypothetical protein
VFGRVRDEASDQRSFVICPPDPPVVYPSALNILFSNNHYNIHSYHSYNSRELFVSEFLLLIADNMKNKRICTM